jgi:hypothetical protein
VKRCVKAFSEPAEAKGFIKTADKTMLSEISLGLPDDFLEQLTRINIFFILLTPETPPHNLPPPSPFILFIMFASLLLLSGLMGQPAFTAPAPVAMLTSNDPTEEVLTPRQQARRARRALRANGPEVYKGTTANLYRVVAEGGSPDGPVHEKEIEDTKPVAKNASSKRIK